jgi:LPS sulfotransferase NodH
LTVKYIYILSQRYSGSTLLSFLLATHPEISTIGERRKFYNKSIRPTGNTGMQCSCGKLFQECDFWTDIKKRVLDKVDENQLSINPTEFQLFENKYLNRIGHELLQAKLLHKLPLPGGLLSKKMKNLGQFNQILVEAILEKEGTQVFLDSSKSIEQALYLSLIPEFDMRIIWLSRDPRAQVSSALKYNQWTVPEATKRWMQEMDKNQRVLQKMGVKFMTMRYESLCQRPEAEMKNLFDFIELDATRFSLDFRAQTQHIMGNYSMRLGKDKKIVERKDWLERLSPEQIRQIEDMTADYTHYYTK